MRPVRGLTKKSDSVISTVHREWRDLFTVCKQISPLPLIAIHDSVMGMIFLGNVLEYSPFIVTLFHVCDPSERILDLALLDTYDIVVKLK